LDLEFQQLKQQIVQIADNTEWNGFPVLNGKAGEQVGEMPVYKATSNNQYGDVLLSPTTTRVIEGTASGEQQTITFDTSAIPLSTETATVTFNDLASGQAVVIGGLTLTAGAGGISASAVATAFANVAAASAVGTRPTVTNGTWSGTSFVAGFTSGAASGSAVTFTSVTPNSSVTNLSIAASGTGVVALAPVYTEGGNQVGFTGTRTFKLAGETINLQWDTIKNTAGTAVDTTKLLNQFVQQLQDTEQFGSGSGRSVAKSVDGTKLVLTYAAKDGNVLDAQLQDSSNDNFFKIGDLKVTRNAVTQTQEMFDNNGRFLKSGNLVITCRCK